MKHQLRNCLYRESLEVTLKGFEKKFSDVIKQMKSYRNDGFPFNYGMFEANVIYRAHNDERIKQQSDDWWNEVKFHSKRDQLSLSYTLWKNKIPFAFLLPEDEWSRNSVHLECYRHIQQGSFMNKCWVYLKENLLLPIIGPVLYPFYKKIFLRA